jgi:hypothetical protein
MEKYAGIGPWVLSRSTMHLVCREISREKSGRRPQRDSSKRRVFDIVGQTWWVSQQRARC